MTPDDTSGIDIHSEAFLARLKRRQLRLSIACASAFLVALLGMPLLNYHFPEAMAVRVGGVTLTWLAPGGPFVPLRWGIAWAFMRRSTALGIGENAAGVGNMGRGPGRR